MGQNNVKHAFKRFKDKITKMLDNGVKDLIELASSCGNGVGDDVSSGDVGDDEVAALVGIDAV